MVTVTPAQQIAANPHVNAWVAASAGTGKTKVLTDRLLNLMLHGSEPERILCLTFTQAASAEMQNRLMKRLSRWTTLAINELEEDLTALISRPPTVEQTRLARQLFLKVLDTPGGMKIQTIHGFCQSLLARFPLEAQLPPQVTIMDEGQADQLLQESCNAILSIKDDYELEQLLGTISHHIKEFSFQELLESILSQRSRFRDLLAHWATIHEAEQSLKMTLELSPEVDLKDPDLITHHITKWCTISPYHHELLSLNKSKPHDILSQWLAEPEERPLLFDAYCRLFLTTDGRISLRPKIKHALEAERVFLFQKEIKALFLAQKTLSLYGLCARIFHYYQDLKLKQGKLDYDDLIEQTCLLLSQPGISSWILYKLDGGIDHILVDEAQDTNPAQWHIIRLMSEEFFTPDRLDRTLFVVGDAKQSIYSFQGANPKDFMNFRTFFAERLQQGQFPWHDVDLKVSFRSAPIILELVDRIFSLPHHQKAVFATTETIHHLPHRQDAQGHIEIWPPILDDQKGLEIDAWPLPQNQWMSSSCPQQLAEYVADQIHMMIEKGLYVPSTRNSAQPKDILILLRKRSAIIPELIRALKARDIPVAGADRLILHDHIAIEDLLSLAKFALLPEDDLSLAEVLKSPLIGLNEEELFKLAYGRSGSLWQEIKKAPDSFAYQFLSDLLGKVDYLSPYDWFQRVLIYHKGEEKFLSRLGKDAEDVLYVFAQGVLDYQITTGGTLQQYIDYFMANLREIKRDASDQQYNQIRIMTVHGSKGLQAPIVILLDHLDGKEPIERILWQANEDNKTHLMLVRPNQQFDLPLSQRLKQELTDSQDDEDKRLLYVALTRAQDHLFVGGWGKKVSEESWYATISHHHALMSPSQALFQKSVFTPQELSCLVPQWLYEIPLSWTAGNKLSPKSIEDNNASLSRGIIIHKLLEVLADCPKENRSHLAHQVLAWYDESHLILQDDLNRLLELLDAPLVQSFFSANSQAEVDIHGLLEGQPFHGRIDRLIELEEELWILDYKSSLHSTIAPDHIPSAYRKQLQHYKTCLEPLYPHKEIRCFLLWTDAFSVVEVI